MARKSIVSGFSSSRPEVLTLKAGEHVVSVSEIRFSDSFHLWDGSEKTNLPDWNDPTPILSVKMKNDSGSFIHNLHLLGFSKFMELDDSFVKEYNVEESNDYALIQNGLLDPDLKDTDLADDAIVRIPDNDRTEQCQIYLNRFMWAVFEEEDKSIEDLLSFVKEGDVQIRILIEEDPYKKDGKDVIGYKISKFMPL